MTKSKAAAVAAELSPGERKVREKKKRRFALFGALFAAGFIPGALLGWSRADSLFSPDTVWPAWISILLAVTFVVAVGTGAVLLNRQLDELERQTQYKAAGAAAGLFVIVYPIWWVLWMGGLVREPIHWVMFLLFYLSFIASWIYYRLK